MHEQPSLTKDNFGMKERARKNAPVRNAQMKKTSVGTDLQFLELIVHNRNLKHEPSSYCCLERSFVRKLWTD